MCFLCKAGLLWLHNLESEINRKNANNLPINQNNLMSLYTKNLST